MPPLTRRRIQAEQSIKAFEKRGKRRILRALLCKSDGTFDVTGRDGFLYARLMRETGTQLAEVRNPISIQRIVNLPVLVEETSTGYVLLGIDTSDYFANPLANTVGSHADQHIIGEAATGGFDPLPIYNAALVNLHTRAQVTPDMTVHVEEGAHMTGGSWLYFAGANTAALVAPAGAGDARYDLVYVGSDNALHVVTGVEVTSPTVPTKPTVPVSATPVGWILMSNGDTAITQSMIYEPRVTAMATLSTTPGTFAQGAGTLSVSTVNDATIADHTHAITSSSNPGAAASLLASDASGNLQLEHIGLGIASDNGAKVLMPGGGLVKWIETTEIGRFQALQGLSSAGFILKGKGNAAQTKATCILQSECFNSSQTSYLELFADQVNSRNYIMIGRDTGTFVGVSIGTDAVPNGYLDVAAKFVVDSNGDIVKLRNVTTTFPAANAAGYLTNNGTGTLSWSSTATPAAHNVLSATHGDTLTASVVRGDIIYGNATPKWARLALGGIAGSVVTRDATDVTWSTGALSFSGAYTLTIPATGTAALLATANVFTAIQEVSVSSASIILTLTQGAAWNGSNYALYVNGYSYLNGFRINGGDAQRSLYMISAGAELGFGSNAGDITFTSTTFGGYLDNIRSVVIKATTGYFGIGVNTSPATLLHAVLTDATTNAVVNAFTLGKNVTDAGIGANGLGVGTVYTLESSTTADTNAALDEVSWVDATHATRKARRIMSVYDTAVREAIRIEAFGSEPGIGLLGGLAAASTIGILGQAAKTISMNRHVTANTAGNNLTVQAGGATSGATDKSGGILYLLPGLSTGTAKSSVRIQRTTRAASTGTGDNTLVDAHIIPSVARASAEGAINLFEVAMPDNSAIGGLITFQILATDGTDFQAHSGHANYAATNKAGVYNTQIQDEPAGDDANAASSGALTDTWAITSGTNKVTISVTVACTTIVANDIQVFYTIHNGSAQAVTQL